MNILHQEKKKQHQSASAIEQTLQSPPRNLSDSHPSSASAYLPPLSTFLAATLAPADSAPQRTCAVARRRSRLTKTMMMWGIPAASWGVTSPVDPAALP